MFVTYTPENGTPQIWEFDPEDEWSDDMILVEKQYGGTWLEFTAAVMSGDTSARRVLIWHLTRREHPTLSFRDLPRFKGRQVVVEQSVAELESNRATWEKAGGPEKENGALMGAMFDQEIEAARAKFGDGPGKAPSSCEPAATPG